jgi:putative inorganic carbon (hco3(-)) transporter
MKIIQYCNKVVVFSFYSLFFLVPLVFWGSTSELFELNKMWLTYILTFIILGAWLTEIIAEKQIKIKRTPLDIPLILFLFSQIISTVISLDSYVSFWGYYSRFNGGLLSTICYLILYFALTTHFNSKQVIKLLKITLISGLLVALWGLPSHFGFDPTCFVFRHTLNVSCWTDAFKPTIRIFSTLGQPAWLAAYLAVLIPLTMAFALKNPKSEIRNPKQYQNSNDQISLKHSDFEHSDLSRISIFDIRIYIYLLLNTLFYACLLFTNTRAGFLGFWIANLIFWVLIFLKKIFPIKQLLSLFLILNSIFLILNFFIGTPVSQLNKFTYHSIFKSISASSNRLSASNRTIEQLNNSNNVDTSITDSGDIRLYVWQGAINAWRANPIIGTGVETFAFAYYKFRPIGHNLTSEWDFLYNKAHNEYLNYLATTGILGLGTYLMIIGIFCIQVIKLLYCSIALLLKHNNRTIEQSDNNQIQKTPDTQILIITIGLFTGWLSILITNFFGFSVVIINLFFFLIPALLFILIQDNQTKWLIYPKQKNTNSHVTISQWSAISIVLMIIAYLIFLFGQYWIADKTYNLGVNFNHSGYYQNAYNYLTDALKLRRTEPVFQDELSTAALQYALALFEHKQATIAAQLASQSVEINTQTLSDHPNYLPFWKTRIRLFYTLGQLEPEYNKTALSAAQQASILAPTDAKIWYNLGVLYEQTKQSSKAIEVLQKTINLKPDYQDAFYALALVYHDSALNKDGEIIDQKMQSKAMLTLNKLLQIDPKNAQALKSLKEWTNKK